MEAGWTPRSPRAGFASDGAAEGTCFAELREKGRWVADSSLRVYIDVVAASKVGAALKLAGLEPAIVFAQARFLDYFPTGCFDVTPTRQPGRR